MGGRLFLFITNHCLSLEACLHVSSYHAYQFKKSYIVVVWNFEVRLSVGPPRNKCHYLSLNFSKYTRRTASWKSSDFMIYRLACRMDRPLDLWPPELAVFIHAYLWLFRFWFPHATLQHHCWFTIFLFSILQI